MAVHRRLIDDRHLSDISKRIVSWENLAPYLEISGPEIAAIKQANRSCDLQKTDLLRRWRKINGEKATYHVLIEAAKLSDQEELAVFIKSLLGECS